MGATMLNSRPANARVKLDCLPETALALARERLLGHSDAAHHNRNASPTMFETKTKPLLPRSSYYARLARSAAIGLLVIVIALGAGMFGYHHFEGMPWIDAFANAAMILSGMGPLTTLTTAEGKLFAGFYALFSGLVFVVVMGIVFAPVVHRFMHRFHLEVDKKDS
jgi:hypothetical protein